MTWAVGIVYTIAAVVFVLGYLTYVVFSDRNSRWRFAEAELRRFHVEEKLSEKKIEIDGQTKSRPFAIIEKLKGRE